MSVSHKLPTSNYPSTHPNVTLKLNVNGEPASLTRERETLDTWLGQNLSSRVYMLLRSKAIAAQPSYANTLRTIIRNWTFAPWVSAHSDRTRMLANRDCSTGIISMAFSHNTTLIAFKSMSAAQVMLSSCCHLLPNYRSIISQNTSTYPTHEITVCMFQIPLDFAGNL